MRLSTTEKAVVHIAHGCAILERHGGGLPLELRLQVRAAVGDVHHRMTAVLMNTTWLSADELPT